MTDETKVGGPNKDTLTHIIEETQSALSTAEWEARQVDRLTVPDGDGPILDAMSALEDCAGAINALQDRLVAALRGLS